MVTNYGKPVFHHTITRADRYAAYLDKTNKPEPTEAELRAAKLELLEEIKKEII